MSDEGDSFGLCLVAQMVLANSPMTAGAASAEDYRCPPTREEEMGPFPRPNAPLRSKIGFGYLLTGPVKSTRDCTPLSQAGTYSYPGRGCWFSGFGNAALFAEEAAGCGF